jgi:hypothetical protein
MNHTNDARRTTHDVPTTSNNNATNDQRRGQSPISNSQPAISKKQSAIAAIGLLLVAWQSALLSVSSEQHYCQHRAHSQSTTTKPMANPRSKSQRPMRPTNKSRRRRLAQLAGVFIF